MSLRDLPEDARPREKMLARGPAALSDSELLALLLRTGVAGKNVLHLAQDMLDAHGGLRGLLQAPAAQLQDIKGMGAGHDHKVGLCPAGHLLQCLCKR